MVCSLDLASSETDSNFSFKTDDSFCKDSSSALADFKDFSKFEEEDEDFLMVFSNSAISDSAEVRSLVTDSYSSHLDLYLASSSFIDDSIVALDSDKVESCDSVIVSRFFLISRASDSKDFFSSNREDNSLLDSSKESFKLSISFTFSAISEAEAAALDF
ncbi:hypothetical protein WICPIJ_003839 [Wickerhamomyces pijperi]|uniref:Uncharacterized protein n=1 Tax=Wickerhamomyces pijperi TaxID=599730 RepID=A0A9P8Q6Q2_WICPI|nr:hypothetical protein WICPIJ_003839 [Wickerhamomyces pijperi]